ncbi:hypothetical protein [Actinomadura decatromicini]|uniref:Leucine-rich repeat domain-containing protein n=1 Tax=Actinomadura decatromicini TaxID=2604572 RepID=A0A5D3F5R4_9ACTN|nr:hypothetical protein [Actinomadura decatromicini]TYK43020.1 hypothetical protein FXF68_39725 [Actinomadura decatromicini]
MPKLLSLSLGTSDVRDLGFLEDLSRLRSFWHSNCGAVTDYSPLHRHRTLSQLSLRACFNLTSLDALPPLRFMRTLGIGDSCLGEGGLDELCREAPHLSTLDVSGCDWVTSLRPLTGLPLTDLRLDGCQQASDFDALRDLPAMELLSLIATGISDLEPLRSLSRLSILRLDLCASLNDLRPLASLPRLRNLYITDAAPGLDLAPLAANRKLTVHIAPGQEVRNAEALGRRLKVA